MEKLISSRTRALYPGLAHGRSRGTSSPEWPFLDTPLQIELSCRLGIRGVDVRMSRPPCTALEEEGSSRRCRDVDPSHPY